MRRLRPRLALVLAMLLGGLAATPASASTVAIGFSADPTQDKPIAVTVSGNASGSWRLVVYMTTSTCWSTPQYQSGTRLSPNGGEALNGAFSHTYSFVPDRPQAYRICAFVANAAGTAVDATATRDVTPRRADASAAVSFSSDPTQDKPVTVTVAGTAELPRMLVVFVTTSTCWGTPQYQDGTRLSPAGGQAVDGSYSYSYSFTPETQRGHRVCAYVVRGEDGTVDATGSREVTPRGAHVLLSVTMPSSMAPGQAVPVTVAGSAELPRRLDAFLTTSTCWGSPQYQDGSRLTPPGGEAVDGSFSQSYSFTPEKETTYRVCAYVSRDQSGEIDATGTGHTVVSVPRQPDPPRTPIGHEPSTDVPAPDVAPVSLLQPAPGVTGTMLRPTFSWTGPSAARDFLVLSYRVTGGFRPYLAVSSRGASWISADDFEDAETLLDAIDDPKYRAEGLASLVTSGGQATVTFDEDFEPGRYSWVVFTGRGSESGTLVPSEEREFVVHGPELKSLRVKTRARKGSSTASPGSTQLRISTTRYASLRIELRRGGKRSVRNLTAGDGTTVTTPVAWSCKRPGGRYRYRVIARDSHGRQRTVSGTFRPVSLARCRSMRKQEQRAKAARQREVDRRVAERRRAEAAAQRRETDRFKSNCRKLGGTPRLIGSSDGSYWVCVSPWGGIWNVPM